MRAKRKRERQRERIREGERARGSSRLAKEGTLSPFQVGSYRVKEKSQLKRGERRSKRESKSVLS